MSQQAIGITLGLLLIVFAFLPNEIRTKDSLPIRLDGIKIILIAVAILFWVSVFWS
jgi:hypothetical protein